MRSCPKGYLLGAVFLRLLGLGALADERLVDVRDHTACKTKMVDSLESDVYYPS